LRAYRIALYVCCSVLQVCCNCVKSVLQCIEVYYSVSQCVAVCCSELQLACLSHRLFVRGNVLQRVARVCCRAVTACYSVLQLLQCVAVCCSVLQCVACCSA